MERIRGEDVNRRKRHALMRSINARGTYQERLLLKAVNAAINAWHRFAWEVDRPIWRFMLVPSSDVPSNYMYIFDLSRKQ